MLLGLGLRLDILMTFFLLLSLDFSLFYFEMYVDTQL